MLLPKILLVCYLSFVTIAGQWQFGPSFYNYPSYPRNYPSQYGSQPVGSNFNTLSQKPTPIPSMSNLPKTLFQAKNLPTPPTGIPKPSILGMPLPLPFGMPPRPPFGIPPRPPMGMHPRPFWPMPGFDPCFRPCDKKYQPVCADGKKTFHNVCQFKIAQCRNPSLYITSWSACPGDCFENGKILQNGQRFRRDICENQCRCEKGTVVCERKFCPPVNCAHPVSLPGSCCLSCPVAEGKPHPKLEKPPSSSNTCMYGGRVFYVGDKVRQNSCQDCLCKEGGLFECKMVKCKITKCARPFKKLPTDCCYTCSECSYQGRTFTVGKTYKQNDCRSCICEENGEMNCTDQTCNNLLTCTAPTRKPGECCPVCEKRCTFNGRTYETNEIFRVDACKTCTCTDEGFIRCSVKECPVLTCTPTIKVPGRCCKQCDTELKCIHKGVFRSVGTFVDGCNTCECKADGKITCDVTPCSDPLCATKQLTPVTLEGACCPICLTGCADGKKLRNLKEIWVTDDCKKKICDSLGTIKDLTMCAALSPTCKKKLLVGCCNICLDPPTNGQEIICTKGNVKIKLADKYKLNDCVDCICDNTGTLACHNPKKCPKLECVNRVKKLGECCEICSTTCKYESNIYELGPINVGDPCKKCNCKSDGTVTCTAVVCADISKCKNTEKPKGSCCPKCIKGCKSDDGKFRKKDVPYKTDRCTTCVCTGKKLAIKCETKNQNTCPKLSCLNPTYFEDECCPICADPCLSKESVVPAGLTFEKDNCNFCTCQRNGKITCQRKLCKPVTCINQVVVAGECCPSCPPDCIKNGIAYNRKQVYKIGKCNTCKCGANGDMECQTEICPTLTCHYTHTEKDACCPKCVTFCREKKKVIAINEVHYKNLCTKCTCMNTGKLICQNLKKSCPKLTCSHKIKVVGQCCETCSSVCKDTNGVSYPHGTTFNRDPCNICVCNADGTIKCTETKCPTLTCKNQVSVKGECCKKCRNQCIADGNIYQVGEHFIRNGCETCTCNADGGVTCVKPKCPVLTCTVKETIPGRCCPVCSPSCTVEGRKYLIGERFQQTKCKECECTFFGIRCTDATCQPLICTSPITPAGKCCSECPTGCRKGKRSFGIGEEFTDKDCSVCKCTVDGTITCTAKQCPSLTCPNPIQKAGECCKVCPKTCVTGTLTYAEGDISYTTDCKKCECKSGTLKCEPLTCAVLTCANKVKPQGACCSHCQDDRCTITSPAMTLLVGQIYVTSECKQRTCTAGGTLVDVDKKCPAICSTDKSDPCCRFCPEICKYENGVYLDGTQFIHKCKTCTCKLGKVNCVDKSCTPVPTSCTKKETINCCETCTDKFCKKKDANGRFEIFEKGTTVFCQFSKDFKTTTELTYACSNGELTETKKECSALPANCVAKYSEKNECCPKCLKLCLDGTTRHKPGDVVVTNCQTKKCQEDGTWATPQAVACPHLAQCKTKQASPNSCCEICLAYNFCYDANHVGQKITKNCVEISCPSINSPSEAPIVCPALGCPPTEHVKPEGACCSVCPPKCGILHVNAILLKNCVKHKCTATCNAGICTAALVDTTQRIQCPPYDGATCEITKGWGIIIIINSCILTKIHFILQFIINNKYCRAQ
ncbi:hypothetical protein SNEBB_008356 [Seison nebaliae]|nr:hypothetical protein SNEBB_008356 [Seison nebaliae]